MSNTAKSFVWFIVGLVLACLLWEVIPLLFDIPPIIFPRFSRVIHTFFNEFTTMLPDLVISLQRIVVGFLLGCVTGVLGGFALGASSTLYNAFYPILIALYSIPKQALIPLIVLWVGFGTAPAIIISVLTSFFPVLVNVAVAFKTIPPELRDFVRLNGGNAVTLFYKISIPFALPYLFAGMKVAVVSALVGVTLAEMLASKSGLGYQIIMALTAFKIPLLFSYVILTTLISILFYELVHICDIRFSWWAYKK